MLTIDRALYANSADLLAQANQTLTTVASSLFDALSDASVSAGEGKGAQAWCRSYEQAASAVTAEISQLVDAFGSAATLLDASGHNHARAEAAAAPYGITIEAPSRLDLVGVSFSGIPTMYGGNSGEPWGWSLIADRLGGFAWPGADIDRIRDLATAWHAAADSLDTATYFPALANGYLDTMDSPELPAAIEVCERLTDVCSALGSDCNALGDACASYADTVADARTQVKHAFKELLGAAGIGAGVSIGAALLSGGLSTLLEGALGEFLEGTIAGTYINRIIAVLDTLADILAASNPAMAISDAQGSQSTWLTALANAKPVLAAVEADTSMLATEVSGVLPGGGAAGGAGLTDDEIIDAGWADRRTLQDHFDRHGGDVNATNEAGYVQAAQELRARAAMEGLPTKTDKNGTVRIFDPRTGLFASFRADGRARTIFLPRPSPNAYWAKQPGVLK